jgi:DNA invertase Pin-like site-specific DNA recombinase
VDTRLLESSPFFLRTIDLAPTHVPERPGLYKRISYDKLGLAEGVARQDEDCELLRERMGWEPFVRRYDENDTSAYRKRKVRLADGRVAFRVIRPAFRQMLDDLEAGIIDGIVFYDMDRLARQPRDLEDLIDWVEYKKVPVKPVTGDIDLMTSGGRMLARMLVSVALKSSEDTSRRQARAAVQHAQQGRVVRGGPRRFGWEADGQTLVPAEAELLREVATRVENGESLTTIALDFQRRKIPTVGGSKWTRTALNNILRNPRLGGIRAYSGVFHESRPKVNEWWLRAVRYDGEWVRGDWTPILTVDEWILLQNTLDAGTGRGARDMKTPAATGRKHLLSGLCICGKCETRMVGRMVRSMRMYGCRPKDLGGCNGVSRNADKVDRLVTALAIDYLKRENVRPRRTGAHRAVKAGDLERLQARKAGLRSAWSSGQINDEDFYATLAELNARIESARAAATAGENIRQLPSRATQIAELESSHVSNERKRLILSEIIERITIRPSSRGAHFNPDDIEVVWREHR